MVKVDIRKSTNADKKLMAIFYDDSGKKIKTTHFGSAGMSDYTKHNDDERKKRYIERHKVRENWADYKSPGALSKHILWNKPTLTASINDYKNKFKLK